MTSTAFLWSRVIVAADEKSQEETIAPFSGALRIVSPSDPVPAASGKIPR
jgi:hypothetical protein